MTGIDIAQLATLLLLAAIVAATDLYLVLIRRRERGRRDGRQPQADSDEGLRGVAGSGLVDQLRSARDGPGRGESRRTSRWVQRWRGMSSTPSTREDTSPERDRVRNPDDGT